MLAIRLSRSYIHLVKPHSASLNRTQSRQRDRDKAKALSSVIEIMAANINVLMAEADQTSGQFHFDGVTGDFETSPLLTTLCLSTSDGRMSVKSRLRNEVWSHAVAVSFPDHTLKPLFDTLHEILEALHFDDLTATASTVH